MNKESCGLQPLYQICTFPDARTEVYVTDKLARFMIDLYKSAANAKISRHHYEWNIIYSAFDEPGLVLVVGQVAIPPILNYNFIIRLHGRGRGGAGRESQSSEVEAWLYKEIIPYYEEYLKSLDNTHKLNIDI